MPRPLYPQGKRAWYPLDRRLVGPQSLSGRGDEEKNSQSVMTSNPNDVYNKTEQMKLSECLIQFSSEVLLTLHVPSKTINVNKYKYKIYKTLILPVVLYKCTKI
jgi:hypothetical protein